MGILDRYGELESIPRIVPSERVKAPEEIVPIILPDDSKCITLAEFSPKCADIIRVHSLLNYRRKPEMLTLVPGLRVGTDCLMFNREELIVCTPIL